MSDFDKPTYQTMPKPTPPTTPLPPPPTPPSHKRLCDYCNTTTALVYCRADTAKLCLSCDREVHSTNQLFSKHTRSQLCDSCDASPASIFCETEHSVFCQNCDWEKHNSVSSVCSSIHTRRPFEGFNGCPSVSELMSILGVEDLGYKKSVFLSEESSNVDFGVDGDCCYEDLLIWETPPAVFSIDDLIASSDGGGQRFQALGVPPLPKNRNAVCGQHKEQVLHQLRELSRLELNSNHESDTVPSNVFQSLHNAKSLQPQHRNAVGGVDAQSNSVINEEENFLQWFASTGDDPNEVFVPSTILNCKSEKSCMVPEKQSNMGSSINHSINDGQGKQLEHPVTARTTSILPKSGSHELNSQERETAISRYKEKKKSRRYEKHIRYESRKVRAESRTRVRGRFAKMDR